MSRTQVQEQWQMYRQQPLLQNMRACIEWCNKGYKGHMSILLLWSWKAGVIQLPQLHCMPAQVKYPKRASQWAQDSFPSNAPSSTEWQEVIYQLKRKCHFYAYLCVYHGISTNNLSHVCVHITLCLNILHAFQIICHFKNLGLFQNFVTLENKKIIFYPKKSLFIDI